MSHCLQHKENVMKNLLLLPYRDTIRDNRLKGGWNHFFAAGKLTLNGSVNLLLFVTVNVVLKECWNL